MSAQPIMTLDDPARGVMRVRVGAERPDRDAIRDAVRDPRAGAVVVFDGVTREVDALEYEAYVEMAAEQIVEIAAGALDRHGACLAAVEHVVGPVPLGEPSVVIAVSAPHRDEAFAAAREIIDELKQLAPIWKVERRGEDRLRVDGLVPPSS